jgi:nuclear cap-binding protein subunit 1
VKLRKQLLSLAESPLRRVEDEIVSIARSVRDGAVDEGSESSFVREEFLQLALQLVVEQPFKIPFVAAVVLVLNALRDVGGENADNGDVTMEGESNKGKREVGVEIAREVVKRAAKGVNDGMKKGNWREVKLYLKFLGALQGMLSGEGVFPVLEDILGKAVDLQTENNEEVSLVLSMVSRLLDFGDIDSNRGRC